MAAIVQIDSTISSFAKGIEKAYGYDHNVILAHWKSEQDISSLSSWEKAYNNPAGIKPGNDLVDKLALTDSNGHLILSKGGFLEFPTAVRGYQAYATLLSQDRNYTKVREAFKTGDPQKELQALAESPWDAGHYGGDGRNLYANYAAVTGSSVVFKGDAKTDPFAPSAGTPEGQKLKDDVHSTVKAQASAWLRDGLGLNMSAWEFGVVLLGSIGILIILLRLFMDAKEEL